MIAKFFFGVKLPWAVFAGIDKRAREVETLHMLP